MKKSFGLRLKELRGSKSQAQIAEFFGVGQSAYSAWELDKKEPDHNTIRTICRHYSVSADWLLGLEDPADAKAVAERGRAVYDSPVAETDHWRDMALSQQAVIASLTKQLEEVRQGKAHAKTHHAPVTGANVRAG
jgi:transcriptional regulator with XRE-family HTH domain